MTSGQHLCFISVCTLSTMLILLTQPCCCHGSETISITLTYTIYLYGQTTENDFAFLIPALYSVCASYVWMLASKAYTFPPKTLHDSKGKKCKGRVLQVSMFTSGTRRFTRMLYMQINTQAISAQPPNYWCFQMVEVVARNKWMQLSGKKVWK